MTDLKPITAYIHSKSTVTLLTVLNHSNTITAGAPNPVKILIILEALGIQYKAVHVDNIFAKEDWLVKLNPNGRIPIIEDPNTGITIWESGAIIEYLVETYDKDGKLGVTDTKDKWLLKQYLHFQMSGQVSVSSTKEGWKLMSPFRVPTMVSACGTTGCSRRSPLRGSDTWDKSFASWKFSTTSSRTRSTSSPTSCMFAQTPAEAKLTNQDLRGLRIRALERGRSQISVPQGSHH